MQLMETLLEKTHLRWVEHVLHMDEVQLSKVIMYGEQVYGARTSRGQKKRYTDQLNNLHEATELRANWTGLAEDRTH